MWVIVYFLKSIYGIVGIGSVFASHSKKLAVFCDVRMSEITGHALTECAGCGKCN